MVQIEQDAIFDCPTRRLLQSGRGEIPAGYKNLAPKYNNQQTNTVLTQNFHLNKSQHPLNTNSMENRPKVIAIGQKIMNGEAVKVSGFRNHRSNCGNRIQQYFKDNSCHCTDTVYTFGQYEYDNEYQEKEWVSLYS